MKTAAVDQEVRTNSYHDAGNNKLATQYPRLYCPRCGSYEIGLRRLVGDQAVWGCRDCTVMFNLDFPRERRF